MADRRQAQPALHHYLFAPGYNERVSILRSNVCWAALCMDEQTQFRNLLREAQAYLPPSVVATCESLNEHGEWEVALSHCQFSLAQAGVNVPDSIQKLVVACEKRFKSSFDA
jgi:hypothetical protein